MKRVAVVGLSHKQVRMLCDKFVGKAEVVEYPTNTRRPPDADAVLVCRKFVSHSREIKLLAANTGRLVLKIRGGMTNATRALETLIA